MIERIMITLLTRLTAYLMARGLEKVHGAQAKSKGEADIDAKLEKFKGAYKEAFDGTTVTAEQRKKLNLAIRDFIANADSGGL